MQRDCSGVLSCGKRRRTCQASLAAFALCVLLVGCQKRNQYVAPPPPEVDVASPVAEQVPNWFEFTGTTRATETVELRARVSGYLQSIRFTDSSFVKKGDLLFEIDAEPFQAKVDAAAALLKDADVTLREAESQFARTESLFKSKTVTKEAFEADEAKRDRAAARVAQLKAELHTAEINLGYTKVYSPLTGRIGRRLVDSGNLVTADQTLLAVVEAFDPINAYFSISENDLLLFSRLRREAGQGGIATLMQDPPKLELGMTNEPGFPHKGVLDFAELGADPSTGTVLRRGIFPNPDGLIFPGLFVRVRAQVGKPGPKLLIPERAVGADQRGRFVLVVDKTDKGDVVRVQPVKLGGVVAGVQIVEIVESGLTTSDRVIVSGTQRARPEMQVTPKEVPFQVPDAFRSWMTSGETMTRAAPAPDLNGKQPAEKPAAAGGKSDEAATKSSEKDAPAKSSAKDAARKS